MNASCGHITNLMIVTVVNVGIVRMRVLKRRMLMRMRVRFRAVPVEIVLVLVMAIVAVFVRMFHWKVFMLVFVRLGQMQPDPTAHERSRCPENRTRDITQHHQ